MTGKRIWSSMAVMLVMTLCLAAFAIPVNAEEAAGYHETTTTEAYAADDWYAVSRGNYLGYGQSKVMQAGTRRVSISGCTQATRICDDLRLGLYLDESPDNDSYGTIGVYHFTATNDSSVSGGESEVRAISDYYYRARGVHQVTEGGVTEMVDTCTDAITAL